MQQPLTCVEICAGAGGQALGLAMAGFVHVALVEYEKDYCEVLKQNRPEWNVICADVHHFDGHPYKGVDLLAGGVPRPPFSVAGKQLGQDDERDLFPEPIRLPKLQFAPPSTKNIDAISVNGERYSIKCITTNTTGAFYGIEKDTEIASTKPLFEYVVVIKLDENYQPEFILELNWETFFKHKHWHSRIGAYNLVITNSLIEDGKMVYKKN